MPRVHFREELRCASVKKKGSTEQCSAMVLKGHTLCGTHARAKYVTLWTEAHNDKTLSLRKAQALVRGWLIRKRLKYSGPGVLKRSDLANNEDLETCEEASREHPFEYFAFEENGKVWWFHFATIWKWCLRSADPTNPYTKVPLTAETRKRLRAMWAYKFRHKLPLPEEPTIFSERLAARWNIICQLFADYGFGNINPNIFTRMGKMEYSVMFRFLRDDMEIAFSNSSKTKRFVLAQCNRMIGNAHVVQSNIYILNSAYILMVLLMHPKDPYVLAFTLLSALYRC